MRRIALSLAVVLAISAPTAIFAMDHGSMEHGSMKMENAGAASMGKVVHEEVVDGAKAVFRVKDIKDTMAKMGMKETHHIMVNYYDARSNKPLGKGEVKVKVIAPDKSEQVKDLMAMENGFGADFTMAVKGKYGIIAKSKLSDGKIRVVKFWHSVK